MTLTDTYVEPDVHAVAPERNRRNRLVPVLLVGVLLLITAGAVGAWALTGGGTAPAAEVQARPTASPTAAPSSQTPPAADSPTAEVLGRDVFAPLVDVAPAGPGDGITAGSVEVTPAPTAAPPPTVTAEGPTSTVTRTQVGTTVTVTGTTTVAGPTGTVTTTTGFTYVVKVASVTAPAVADSDASFIVNGTPFTAAAGNLFAGVFTYVDYDAGTGLVSFTYGTALVQIGVGQTVGVQ